MDEVIENKLEYKAGRFIYFAYGSNMLVKRLQHPERRCPSAEKIKPSEGSQHMIRNHRFISFYIGNYIVLYTYGILSVDIIYSIRNYSLQEISNSYRFT